jgi:hypothetical protein
MSITKGKIVFDTTATADSDNIGAYLRSSDGTLITHTNVGGKDALDVNIANTSIVVTATNLDIRDLAFATDKVDVTGSEVSLDATTLAALENITVQNGAGAAAVNIQDGGNSITVDASDLDIRNLSAAQDNVAISDGTDTLAINNDGSINVQVSGIDFSFDYAEDSAHVSGDIGAYVLSVREDTLSSSTGASGDYQSFKTDALGRLYTNDAAQTAAYGAVSVLTTATDIVASDLTNRRKIIVQNIDNKPVYIGSNASVTTSNGIRLDAGSALELEVAAGVNLHGITAAGTAAVRYFEIA